MALWQFMSLMSLQDEPTSGLDARAAAIVMRTVRNTVNTGRTVVCTIHQPSIDIFEVMLGIRTSFFCCERNPIRSLLLCWFPKGLNIQRWQGSIREATCPALSCLERA